MKGKSLGMIGLRAFSARAPLETRKHQKVCLHTVIDENEGLADPIYKQMESILAHTMSKLPSIDPAHPSSLIGGIWRKLKITATVYFKLK